MISPVSVALPGAFSKGTHTMYIGIDLG
ncbi:hypothetical protein, partial [Salmonella enterica]